MLLAALAALPQGLHWRYDMSAAGRCALHSLPLPARLRSRRTHHVARRAAHDQVLDAYRAADLFVLANRIAPDGDRDGLPNVLLEAGALELPVVASRIGAVPELIEDGVNGRLVPPGRPAGAGRSARGADARSGGSACAAAAPAPAGARAVRAWSRVSTGLAARLAGVLEQVRSDRRMSGPVAFYAPLKPPDHPVPSGDRRMARALIEALRAGRQSGRAGEPPAQLRSNRRSRAPAPHRGLGRRVAGQLLERYRRMPAGRRPRAWLTYHAYHKSPDWLGPSITAALDIPYLLAEASFSLSRPGGPGPPATPPPNRRSAPPTWCSP